MIYDIQVLRTTCHPFSIHQWKFGYFNIFLQMPKKVTEWDPGDCKYLGVYQAS